MIVEISGKKYLFRFSAENCVKNEVNGKVIAINNPRNTLLVVSNYVPKGEGPIGDVIGSVVAFCSKKDQFSKLNGKKQALSKFFRKNPDMFNRSERKTIWIEFMKENPSYYNTILKNILKNVGN